MYEQHPVPQQISSYSFKLVGNMNLKQFFQIAGGAIIALILYAMPLPVYVKWPLIIISAIAGAAFAFLPIQDRPLEQWLFAFFRSIYSPTVFVWTEEAAKHQYFKPEPGQESLIQQQMMATQIQIELDKTQQSKTSDPEFVQNLDKDESARLNQISSLMQGQSVPAPAEMASATQAGRQDVYIPQGEMIGADTGDLTINQANSPQSTVHSEEPRELVVPVEQRVSTEHKGFEAAEETAGQPREIVQQQMGEVFNATGQNNAQDIAQVNYSSAAAPPITPTQPNILVGQVVDNQGQILDGVILEVKDKQGIPVRAMKTNTVGHFMMVTPLAEGTYNIYIEKEGFKFDPVEITLSNQIVEPIIIKAI